MTVEVPPQLRAEAELGVFKPELPGPEILDEQVLHEQGSFRRVRRYLRGWHPELGGILHMGWQGKETIIKCDVIKAVGRVRVIEGHNGHRLSSFIPGR